MKSDDTQKVGQELFEKLHELSLECRFMATLAGDSPQLAINHLYQLADSLEKLSTANELPKPEMAESPLSPREAQVLSLAAKGQPSKEIAYLLDISARTVQFHMSSVFKKLEVGSRTEAVAKALELKLIPKG